MTEPFLFGEKPLFGVFYPSSDFSADSLVVVCPPLFDEYRRTYRALGEFAAACARNGHHALRFDYSGTGDSGGMLDDIGSIDAWLEDIDDAIEEGMTLSGASRVCLVGVRWGATLACLCRHDAVEKIMAWDWIRDGSRYTRWLEAIDANLADDHRLIAAAAGIEQSVKDYRMFALANSMLESMNAVQIDQADKPVTVFLSRSEQNRRDEQTRGVSGGNIVDLNHAYDWPAFQAGLIRPMLVLRTILDHL